MAKRKVLESRRNERVSAGWRVLVTLPGLQSAEGRIFDVSAGGLQFTAPFQYRRGEKISIDIITAPKHFVRTRILILREGGKNGNSWTYGAKFLDMTKLDRNLLDCGIEELEPEDGEVAARPPAIKSHGFRGLFTWFRGG